MQQFHQIARNFCRLLISVIFMHLLLTTEFPQMCIVHSVSTPPCMLYCEFKIYISFGSYHYRRIINSDLQHLWQSQIETVCCVFRVHHQVWSTVLLRAGLIQVNILMYLWSPYKPCPFNGKSCSDTVLLMWRFTWNTPWSFYPGLPHIHTIISHGQWT